MTTDRDARLLIVDDNEDNRFTLGRRLKREGFNILDYAEDGEAALDALRRKRYDLVFLDIMMPKIDGFEVLETMKADEALRDTPVIMISALSEMDAVVRAIDLGAEDHLAKPFNPTLLRARLLSTLEKRRLRVIAVERAKAIDASSGLPNRRGLMDFLGREEDFAENPEALVVLARLEMDRFRSIVEAFGPDEAECFVRDLVARLRPALPPRAHLARIDASALAVLAPEMASEDAIPGMIESLREALRPPLAVGDQEVTPSVSIGVAWSARASVDGDTLIRDCEAAAGRAQKEGEGAVTFFDDKLNQVARERIDLEAALRHALDRSEFRLVYQPIVEIASGRVRGFEALLRWSRGERGPVSPGVFIPLLEETGLITPVGRWIIREAAARCAEWREAYPDHGDLTVNVNVSGVQFETCDLVAEIRGALEAASLPPDGLKAEVTESIVMRNPDGAGEVMRALDAMGVRCAIDDFGTGYSSFSYLHRFPFTTLKIDRVFVTNIHREPKNDAIVQALASLSHKLGMDVVCEGVETAEELARLASNQADYAQGFHLFRPLEQSAVGPVLAGPSATLAATG